MAKTELQKQSKNPVAQIKTYLSTDSVKKRFEDVLGKRAAAFMNSIVNVVRANNSLQKCTADSVMASAIQAASLNLLIDPALGQAAIVPYGSSASFQVMYKGVLQLCIRTGQYKTIHCSEIYKDELKSHNPITGQVDFNDPSTFAMRDKGDLKNVVGHYAYFKLITGFEKGDYMTHDQAMAHAKRYSKAYQYDLKYKKKVCPWSTDPVAMGNKTILLRLLRKYGVMSVEMQTVMVEDSFDEVKEKADEKISTEAGSKPIEATFEDNQEAVPVEAVKTFICIDGHEFERPHYSQEKDIEVCPECMTEKFEEKKA